jgi:glutamate dehydrogenase (NAD(P)+)
MNKGYVVPGVVTGKPIEIGGSLGRNMATGRGCVFCILEALKARQCPADGCSVAIQGFGNAGSVVAQLMAPYARVIAVSDSRGGIINQQGLDVDSVIEHKANTGSVIDFAGAEAISNKDLLELECDVLVPAALENVITEENASRIKAKIIAEAANGPTTPSAQPILDENGIFVLPDILANAGGVTVSYFEWVQSLQSYFWSEADVNAKLEDIMISAFHAVHEESQKQEINMRDAAFNIGVGRVAKAQALRGIYP